MTGERLLRVYRDTNLHLRVEESYPAYFDTYPNAQAYRERKFGAGTTQSGKVIAEEALFEKQLKTLRDLEVSAEKAIALQDDVLAEVSQAGTAAIQDMDKRLGRAIQKNARDGLREIDKEDTLFAGGGAILPDNDDESTLDEANG